MPRGGARPGAGRKKGAATRKTREAANRIAAEGITPLDVMIDAMRDLWAQGKRIEAATLAKDAAPYIHPRLSSVEANVKHDLSRLSDADLDARLAAFLSGGAAGAAAGAGAEDEAPARTH